jgi:hypothetical protein
VYLLTVAPAQTRQGLALVSGLGNEGASCNVKEIVEGVQFRLYQVSENVLGPTELADEAHLRNVAAYKFFFAAGVGTDAVRDPFGTAPAAQSLTKTPVDDCDVPLALLHWTVTDGLRWVDLWSVRRRLAVADQSSFFPGARAAAVGEAMIRQFDEQVRSMRSAGTVFVRAGDTFRWLPPVGRLPLDAGGLSAVTFFTGFNTREVFIEGARVPSMLRLGASFPPFDVAATDPEMIWLYDVRENRQPFAGLQTAHRYLWFALGHLPYQGTPRFDVSRWDFANYALGVELAAT